MRKKYSVPNHVRVFIKKELYDYEKNKILIDEMKEDILFNSSTNDGQPRGNATSNPTEMKATKLVTTRSILIAEKKVGKIETALEKLFPDEQEIAKKIFFKGYNQVFAQMHEGISKDTYYHVMNKMIYFTALEYGEI